MSEEMSQWQTELDRQHGKVTNANQMLVYNPYAPKKPDIGGRDPSPWDQGSPSGPSQFSNGVNSSTSFSEGTFPPIAQCTGFVLFFVLVIAIVSLPVALVLAAVYFALLLAFLLLRKLGVFRLEALLVIAVCFCGVFAYYDLHSSNSKLLSLLGGPTKTGAVQVPAKPSPKVSEPQLKTDSDSKTSPFTREGAEFFKALKAQSQIDEGASRPDIEGTALLEQDGAQTSSSVAPSTQTSFGHTSSELASGSDLPNLAQIIALHAHGDSNYCRGVLSARSNGLHFQSDALEGHFFDFPIGVEGKISPQWETITLRDLGKRYEFKVVGNSKESKSL